MPEPAPSPLDQALRNLSERVDEDLIPALYQAASVPSVIIRAELEAEGLAWSDPSAGRSPGLVELRASARTIIDRSARTATIRGAVAGTMGLLAVPPEAAAAFVQSLRLAQRLAVVFGFEHETDRGKLILGRALAAGLELELPEQARVDFRLRRVTSLVRQGASEPQQAAAKVARLAGRRLVWTLGGRMGRILPGFGTGLAAWSARRELRRQAERMLPVLEASWEGVPWTPEVVEEAEEIHP